MKKINKLFFFMSLLVLVSCNEYNDNDIILNSKLNTAYEFKPKTFEGFPGGDEFLDISKPYSSQMEFILESYDINDNQDTIRATYRVKNILKEYFQDWAGFEKYEGGEILITLDNSDIYNPKIDISQANEYSKKNPYKGSSFWTAWLNPKNQGERTDDFLFKITPYRESFNSFHFAETIDKKLIGIIDMQFDYQHWSRTISGEVSPGDELIREGSILFQIKFGF